MSTFRDDHPAQPRQFETCETRGTVERAMEGATVFYAPPKDDASWDLVAVVLCSDGVPRMFWRREVPA